MNQGSPRSPAPARPAAAAHEPRRHGARASAVTSSEGRQPEQQWMAGTPCGTHPSVRAGPTGLRGEAGCRSPSSPSLHASERWRSSPESPCSGSGRSCRPPRRSEATWSRGSRKTWRPLGFSGISTSTSAFNGIPGDAPQPAALNGEETARPSDAAGRRLVVQGLVHATPADGRFVVDFRSLDEKCLDPAGSSSDPGPSAGA